MRAPPQASGLAPAGRDVRRILSSHDQIVRSLGQDILLGRILPGEKIPGEADLLERFGVSRTALREALKTLSAKGFLVMKTRVGTKVNDPVRWNYFDAEVLAWQVSNGMDAAFRRSLAEVRRALEPAAAALAAEHRSAGDLAGMREAIAAMRHERSSEVGFARADLELHLRIAVASRNPMMRSFASVIETALLEAFTLSPPTRSEVLHRETVDLHERIVDCIDAGNPAAAAAAMLAVIEAGYQRVEAEKT
ncbi:MAG: FadR family transcriptional regulator [Caulobacteraceae bacterium]|nr:FadR family transcriptional regulator [Caulobacteraceae bacterium]